MVARMASDDVDGACPCCKTPRSDVLSPETCMLDADCCAACVARCMAVDQCGIIVDPAFWENYDVYRSNIGTYWVIDGKLMPFHR